MLSQLFHRDKLLERVQTSGFDSSIPMFILLFSLKSQSLLVQFKLSYSDEKMLY